MLPITIPASPEQEFWDEAKEEFITIPARKEQKLQLEHSLVSLSKWESKWCKPFLSTKQMTEEESIDYVRCMTITQNVPPDTYNYITEEIMKEITDYIAAPMTATTFSKEEKGGANREIITSEIVYYWMFELKIPMECQKWHLNKLLTQIRVCNIKNAPPKKMGKSALMRRNSALNAARRQQFNSNG